MGNVTKNKSMKIITVEEHFMVKSVNDTFNRLNPPADAFEANQRGFVNAFVDRGLITDLTDRRIALMDEFGVDAQVIGYGNNQPMHIRRQDGAVALCKLANDTLFEGIRRHPGRLYGYATLPVDDVEASVQELERCVKALHFVGVMINGPFGDEFLDSPRFYPIFEKAAELNVPVYLHPTEVPAILRNYYYTGSWNERTANTFSGFGIGWHYHVAVHLMRFILSGIFDKLPTLKMIVGHWGELLPFYFDRMDSSLPPEMTGLNHGIKYYFRNHVYTNPSGIFSRDDMEFCIKTFAPDHILWAQDFPYGENGPDVRTFLEEMDLDDEIREDIAHRNAEKLFGI